MSVRIQLRRDTAANWTATNPTLTQGEPGVETDTGKLKIGDGTTAWSSLPYQTGGIEDGSVTNAKVSASAAIAGTKISPDFGSQNVTTTGTVTGASLVPSSSTVPTLGLYQPSAGVLGVATNGTGRLFVDSSGNVGIGVANPATSIDVANVDSTTARLQATTNGVDLRLHAIGLTGNAGQIGTWSNHPLVARVNNTERLRITSAGLVGVGTSSVSALFHVAGDSSDGTQARITGATNQNYQLRWGFDTTNLAGRIQSIHVGTAYRPLLLNPDGGAVGIGTTTPNSNGLVTIYEASGAKLYLSDGQLGLTYGARLTGGGIGGDGAYAELGVVDNNVYNKAITVTSQANNIVFGKGATEKARLDSSGRLLVGTSTDSGGSKLQVNDNRIRIATAKTPASATDTGVAGEICWDASYVYVCTATNTWKRTAISTW